MTHRSRFYGLFLPGLAILPLILMAASGGRGIAAPEASVAPALDCPSCDDFNPCTVDSCDVAIGTCRHDPLNCDDRNSCTVDSCSFDPSHSGSGGRRVAVTPSAGSAGNDGHVCTLG